MKPDIILYCRVSSEDQNVNQQVEYCTKYFCKDYNIIKTIKDKESGLLPLKERKQFKKLLLTANCNIGIYNLDRLTRNWDDVTLIEKYFRENWTRIKLISTSDNIDLSNASGRMMFRIKMTVSCYMPEDMREKQKIGIERAKKEGKYKGGVKGRTWSKKKSK